MSVSKTIWLAVILAVIAAVGVFAWQHQNKLPEPREAIEFAPAEPAGTTPGAGGMNESINLAVPFAPQAPHANWEQPYQDACEEAAIIMTERYLRGAEITLDQMDAEILQMVDFQNENYGFFKDSNIAETVRLAEVYFPGLAAEAFYDVTADEIRAQLTQGKAVVVLADGRLLGNPYYTGEGPDKHALVIKGMQGDKFITNDPGTRHGADYVYEAGVVMNAIVDYDGGTPGTGKKGMIVLTQG